MSLCVEIFAISAALLSFLSVVFTPALLASKICTAAELTSGAARIKGVHPFAFLRLCSRASVSARRPFGREADPGSLRILSSRTNRPAACADWLIGAEIFSRPTDQKSVQQG